MSLAEQFASDPQGRRYSDVLKYNPISFTEIIGFFEDPERQRRMVESELHHDRPALAGVIRELERRDDFCFFMGFNGKESTRLRQAIGVLVKIVMSNHGWQGTGKKGSIGVRIKSKLKGKTRGSAYNTGGLSIWFTRAERYEPISQERWQTVEEQQSQLYFFFSKDSETSF